MKKTFSHGDLEENIYMKQSQGFVVNLNKDSLCMLKKFMCELKKSPIRDIKKLIHIY